MTHPIDMVNYDNKVYFDEHGQYHGDLHNVFELHRDYYFNRIARFSIQEQYEFITQPMSVISKEDFLFLWNSTIGFRTKRVHTEIRKRITKYGYNKFVNEVRNEFQKSVDYVMTTPHTHGVNDLGRYLEANNLNDYKNKLQLLLNTTFRHYERFSYLTRDEVAQYILLMDLKPNIKEMIDPSLLYDLISSGFIGVYMHDGGVRHMNDQGLLEAHYSHDEDLWTVAELINKK